MVHSLEHFLSTLRAPDAQEVVQWATMQLRLDSYLGAYDPPDAYVTSVRCMVLHDRAVLVVRDPHGIHITPGGRREPGETYTETLQREILEETGWLVASFHRLALRHFHHYTPRPDAYPYPYPDFLQLVFSGVAVAHQPDHQEVDGWELGADFVHVNSLPMMELGVSDRLLVNAMFKDIHNLPVLPDV